jgi:hypothetical protein
MGEDHHSVADHRSFTPGICMTRWPALVGSVAAWLASIAAAVSYLATNNWFGAGDLYGMAVWSLPLAVLVGLGARSSSAWLNRRPASVAYPIAILIGGGLGFLTSLLAAFVLGGWLGGFSFPVFFCWVFGGVIGLVSVVWTGRRQTWPAAVLLALAAAVVLARANAYAQAPAPRIRVYAKANATPAEVHQIWTDVIGQPHPSGQGDKMLDGLSGASASGQDGPHQVLTVSFRKATRRARRDSIIARIRRSPLVARVEPVPASDRSGLGVSVEY